MQQSPFDLPHKNNLIFQGKTGNLFTLQTYYDSEKIGSKNLHWRDELEGNTTILPFDFTEVKLGLQWHPSALSSNGARLISVSNQLGNGFARNGTDGTIYSFDLKKTSWHGSKRK